MSAAPQTGTKSRAYKERLMLGGMLADCLQTVTKQAEVARMLALSRERVRQIENEALYKLAIRCKEREGMTFEEFILACSRPRHDSMLSRITQ